MGAWDDFETPESDAPNFWNPEEPATIEGVIEAFDKYVDDDGVTHPQLVLDVDGEQHKITGFRKLLRDAILNLAKVDGAGVGDRVKIEFKGKAAGKRYYLYDAKLVAAAPKRSAKGVDTKEEF